METGTLGRTEASTVKTGVMVYYLPLQICFLSLRETHRGRWRTSTVPAAAHTPCSLLLFHLCDVFLLYFKNPRWSQQRTLLLFLVAQENYSRRNIWGLGLFFAPQKNPFLLLGKPEWSQCKWWCKSRLGETAEIQTPSPRVPAAKQKGWGKKNLNFKPQQAFNWLCLLFLHWGFFGL